MAQNSKTSILRKSYGNEITLVRAWPPQTIALWAVACTGNLRTKILDFRGLDSSIILNLKGGILRSTGDFPEILSQAILVGIILVGRLGVHPCGSTPAAAVKSTGREQKGCCRCLWTKNWFYIQCIQFQMRLLLRRNVFFIDAGRRSSAGVKQYQQLSDIVETWFCSLLMFFFVFFCFY